MSVVDQYYLDTSAILPYYREERASKKVQELLISLKPPVNISDLTRVEFVSALARLVRMGELSEGQASLIESTFIHDIRSGLYLCFSLTAGHYKQAEKWLAMRKTSLRTLDALHLACCARKNAVLITCDDIFSQSADALGIRFSLV